jgi:imidazolonepropionase-like amidohydrolase
MRNLKTIFDAGVLVPLGTDSGATLIRVQMFAEHMELALTVQAGLTPLQAISVAMKNGAQLLRVEDQYGTLELHCAAEKPVTGHSGTPILSERFGRTTPR